MKPLSRLFPMLLAACLGCMPAAHAQQHAPEAIEAATPVWQPGTGDDWLDAQLRDIHRYAERHPETFIDELVRYQGADRGQASAWLGAADWRPGELYLACVLADLAERSCAAVLDLRADAEDDQWASVLEALQAQSGSDRFTRIKASVVASYRRWGRPLELDAELRRAARR